MLGESHSLKHEFPELENLIDHLIASDMHFAKEAARYNSLDTEIRKLELKGSPIEDEDMKRLKMERADLKDELYELLQKASQ
ncbi:DUF465 domain-containing protein [Enterovibrio sp. NIFS-20-8]|nr:DUF465 domain-containing protein [Enterovibrio paralichthyis]MBV7298091.1 DUF465 domain-containing protein [Enterovibrio paralichthyis]